MNKQLRAVLIDLSGTIHIEDKLVRDALEAVNKLRQANLTVRFVSNTTKESRQTLLDRLNRIGFPIDKDHVYTSLTAAATLVRSRDLRPFFVLSEDAQKEFDGLSTEDPNAVVVGLSPKHFHYDLLNEAFRLLMNGASLIATHKGRYYMTKDGLSLNCGAFISALEYSSGVKAEIVGKPSRGFFESVLHDLKCKPGEAVMIGDDVRDDVEGAIKCGIHGILVQTGKYRSGDEKLVDCSFPVCPSIKEAAEEILERMK